MFAIDLRTGVHALPTGIAMPRPAASRPKGKKRTPAMSEKPRELPTRHIPVHTQAMLWGRAAGRCEFAGCNKPLWRSSVTQEPVNIAQKAHIYSFSEDGPRGNAGISEEELNGHDNLLLVCHECHVKIDHAPDGGRYAVAVLRAMKTRHERRVEIVTGIDADRRSHLLLYGANVGDHSSPRLLSDAAAAMFPGRYPAEAAPISLGTLNSPSHDRTDDFWRTEATHLISQFDRRVRERSALGEVEHLSVFALAPQPLLVLLGTLLGDITPADVYQRHREPPTWSWPDSSMTTTPEFDFRVPAATDGPPALVLALSATVTPDRITAVLPGACVWTVTVPTPHNDLTKSRDQLGRFRGLVRGLLDRIKATHGQTTTLHVFPVVSAAMAVELGRVRMPKADTPWRVYDQVNDRGGFVHALSIPNGGDK